jgi:hypothetical protein
VFLRSGGPLFISFTIKNYQILGELWESPTLRTSHFQTKPS